MMSTTGRWEKLGAALLPWVREHRRLRQLTRRELEASEAYRQALALSLTRLRLRVRGRRERDALPPPGDATAEEARP